MKIVLHRYGKMNHTIAKVLLANGWTRPKAQEKTIGHLVSMNCLQHNS